MTQTTAIATVGTRYSFRIQWWQFLSIADRAGKYNWDINTAEGENVYYYNPETMWVYGRVVGETEKAYKVVLDFTKHIYKKAGEAHGHDEKVTEGFTAYIAKKAIKELIEEAEECGVVDNMPCDNVGFCAGTACPMFHECHG